MRILTVSDVPLESHLGSGYIIAGYVERLRAREHEVVTLEPRDYVFLPGLRGAKRLRHLLGYTRAARREIGRGRFDLVELWGPEGWWTARRLHRRVLRPRLVGRFNALEPHHKALTGYQTKTMAGRLLDRWQDSEAAFRCVDGMTTVSMSDRRFALERNYQPPERVVGVENPLRDDWLGQPFVASRPPVLGFVGSWLETKGRDLIVNVLPTLLRDHPTWRVVLVGVGDLDIGKVWPRDIVARVEVVPFVADAGAMRERYRGFGVSIMPSTYEGMGLVAVEAMACGCALVASPTGIAADLVPEREARIVASREPAAWIEAVGALMRDEARRVRIAAGGQGRVQSLRWDTATDRLLGFYAMLLRAAGNHAAADSCAS
jgi:glycosyltransferase involved in cell wall biosynthesis